MRNRAAGFVFAATLLGAAVSSFAQPAAPLLPANAAASASPSPQADPTEAARQRFTEGVRLAKKNEWQKAYGAFLNAWKLTQHSQIALNLGRAEMEVGKYRDAAEHLQYCLDNNRPEHPDAALARGWLDETKRKVVTLKITVEGTGVEVLVDGKVVGVSPLPPNVYVDPGEHTVEARSGRARDEATDTYQAGSVRVMKLAPKEPAAARPVATATESTTALAGTEKPAGAPFPVRTVALASGGAVALVGIALGITGLVLSAGKASERDAFCASAEDKCLAPRTENPQLYDEQKAKWAGFDNDRVAFANMGMAGLVVGGLAAAGTGVAFFLWKPSPSKSDAKHGILIVPAGSGLVISGKW